MIAHLANAAHYDLFVAFVVHSYTMFDADRV